MSTNSAGLDARACLERARELLQAVLDCPTGHDERGHAYLKVPARSIFDLGAVIRTDIKEIDRVLEAPAELPADGITGAPEQSDLLPSVSSRVVPNGGDSGQSFLVWLRFVFGIEAKDESEGRVKLCEYVDQLERGGGAPTPARGETE